MFPKLPADKKEDSKPTEEESEAKRGKLFGLFNKSDQNGDSS